MEVLSRSHPEPGILVLTLNRPARLNALAPELIVALTESFEALRGDRATRAVILTGAGRGFCAGADLQESAAPGVLPDTAGLGKLGFVYRYQEALARLMLAIHESDKPVIAAINGVTVGGGLALALACDVRLAADSARLGATVIRNGLSACDVGISYFLPRVVGAGVAAELMLTGRMVDAAEARELRLVSRVVTPEALPDAAMETARAIAAHSEYGVWMTKRGLWAAVDSPSLRHAMEIENRTQVLGTFTGGFEEAARAFGEGRPPRWQPL